MERSQPEEAQTLKWFVAICQTGHKGAGRYGVETCLVQADNIMRAMSIAQNHAGVQHSEIPTMREAEPEDFRQGYKVIKPKSPRL